MSAQNDSKVPRRQFLQTAAAATAGFTSVPRHVLAGSGQLAPSDRFNVAGVGIGGMGRANLTDLASQNIVALCDADWGYAGAAFDKLGADAAQMEERLSRPPATAAAGGDPAVAARQAATRQRNVEQVANMKRPSDAYPKAASYSDYREMLEKQKDIDGVVVATPDHLHAVIALAAMDLGKHV